MVKRLFLIIGVLVFVFGIINKRLESYQFPKNYDFPEINTSKECHRLKTCTICVGDRLNRYDNLENPFKKPTLDFEDVIAIKDGYYKYKTSKRVIGSYVLRDSDCNYYHIVPEIKEEING